MSEMNTRLEIASRLMAGLCADTNYTTDPPPDYVLRLADALIAEEARTRPNPPEIPDSSPTPDDLRAVAEELMAAIELLPPIFVRSLACSYRVDAALSRARAIGLGGGK